MKKRLRLLSGLLTLTLAVFVLLFIQEYRENTSIEVEQVPEIEDSLKLPGIKYGIAIDSFNLIEATVNKNDFLANILLPHHIDYPTIDRIAKKSEEIFDVRKIAVGKKYILLTSRDSLEKAQYFIYEIDPIHYVVYDLRDTIRIYKGEKEVETRRKSIAGEISSSLYMTLQDANAHPILAAKLSDIFAWSIDFYRLQKGDWFKAIYEEKWVEGKSIGVDKIIAVKFHHFEKDFYGFYFDQNGKEDYFDEEANSLRKAFLKSPLKFSRLSSRYTMRRFHPVQKRWKAHLGTDYAAPTGTPIMSTGDGIVSQSSYTKGNGKYVKIKHNSVYSTQYLHMSRQNVKAGQYVKQGDIIGYVGSTGLATGPHVCYRFWKNGKQVDHLRQEFPSAEPIQENFRSQYEILMKVLKEELEGISFDSKLYSQAPI